VNAELASADLTLPADPVDRHLVSVVSRVSSAVIDALQELADAHRYDAPMVSEHVEELSTMLAAVTVEWLGRWPNP